MVIRVCNRRGMQESGVIDLVSQGNPPDGNSECRPGLLQTYLDTPGPLRKYVFMSPPSHLADGSHREFLYQDGKRDGSLAWNYCERGGSVVWEAF